MNKTFLFHTFLWCILIGMTFSVFGQDASFNRAPVNLDQKHSINFGNQTDGTTVGYGADGIGNMWYSVDIPAGTLTQIGATGGTLHQGGDFDGSGTFYCTLSPSTLATVDPLTGAETVVAAITGVTGGQTITAMAWDASTSTMFLGSTDITTSQLYTLNLTTGVATLVGTIGQSGLIALACNCDGDLYSVDLVGDNLWSIDKNTGVGTAVGPLGFDVNFAQDADFDPADGVLYLSAYNNTAGAGELRTVDLTTGASTLITSWGFLEITDFGIVGTCGPGCPVGAPTNPTPPSGATDIPITGNTAMWTNGAGTTANEVWFNGTMVYDGPAITSLSLAGVEPLMYATTYSWRVVCKNDTCGTNGPNWTFTTMQDPLLANLFCDDFEAGAGNWTITNDGGTCVWDIFTLSRPYTMPPTASGNVFAADADACGSGTTLLSTATLTTPLNFSGISGVYIEFDNDWRTIDAADEAYLEASSDGGSTWTALWSAIGVSVRNTHEVVDASAFDGQPSVILRLRSIQPGWDWWWAIDNFCVYGIIPVEFTSFAANVNDGNVNLTWSTATETNNQGFEVQRSSNGSDYEAISFVQGHGTTTETQFYSYTDRNVAAGSYTYRLKQVDFDGTYDYSNTIEVDVNAPKVFSLDQNYPNPFNPSTKITFNLATDSKVTLKVFDILGQEVMTLLNGNLVAGGHEVNFNASGLNSGVYFYRIDATGANGTNFSDVKKMILTK